MVSEHGVKALFTAPTAIRAIRKEDPDGAHLKKYDISCLRYLFLAGERLDPDTYHWASEKLGIPVVDHWWQTETGWAIAANPLGVEPLPLKAGSPTVPMPGYDVRVLHVDGSGCEPGEEGVICLDSRCLLGPCRHCGATMPVSKRHICASIPGTTSPATAATSTRTGICS